MRRPTRLPARLAAVVSESEWARSEILAAESEALAARILLWARRTS